MKRRKVGRAKWRWPAHQVSNAPLARLSREEKKARGRAQLGFFVTDETLDEKGRRK